MKLKEETSAPDVRVEIIPLIDVIFCILTFFILASLSLTRQQAINLGSDLPKASTGVTQMRQMMLVTIGQYGQVYVENQPVTREQLQQMLTGYQQKNPEGLMVLYASGASPYSEVVGVLDQLRAVGGDRVSLATSPPETTQGNQPTSTTPDFNGQSLPNDPLAAPGLGLPAAPNPYSSNQNSSNQNLLPGQQTLPPSSSTNIPAQGSGTATPGSTTPSSTTPSSKILTTP
jgi:biopolymer transport protein ExbD